MNTGNSNTTPPPERREEPHPAYVYATTLVAGRARLALGMPVFRPPDRAAGWEVCGVSRLKDGLLVSWRRVLPVDVGAPTKT